MQQSLPLGHPKAHFFHDGLLYTVHREDETVIVSYEGAVHRRFRYGTERTPLEQAAQWKIEAEDPLLILDESEPKEGDDAET